MTATCLVNRQPNAIGTRMARVYICTHQELVGLHYKLGSNRLAAIQDATAQAIESLASHELEGIATCCFADWTGKGKFVTQFARVHNYFAIQSAELTRERLKAIRQAAKVFTSVMKQWEKR